MFINSTVTHTKYGKGIITELEIRPDNELTSLVTIRFDSGEIKKFPIRILIDDKFAKIDDEEAVNYISDLKKEEEKKRLEEMEIRKKALEKKIYIPSYNLDEVEREVKKEDWEKALNVAESYRFPNESRAVVMDSDLVFINASAAMRYIEARVKDCDKIYKACETKKNKFLNHVWSYASKDNISAIIKKIEESDK